MRKTAIFDIDGTIFRSSLLIEITEALIHKGIFPASARKVYARAFSRWLDRRGPYENYINAVVEVFQKDLQGMKKSEFMAVSKKVVALHKNRVYRFTRDLVKDLKKKNYFLLAISNSPKMILDEFCRNLGFDKVYGRIFEADKRGRFTGVTLYSELVSDKAKILKRAVEKEKLTLVKSIGVGDTESDIPMLRLVDRPICFNPNEKLYRHAKRAGWEIRVERKDVIYRI
ncbi:MAG: HAD-IB family hydrolase [bacterium]|nr:HAD-IB family hydrolase [bacterium]